MTDQTVLILFLSLTFLGAFALVVFTVMVANQGKPDDESKKTIPTNEEMKNHIMWKMFYVNPNDPRGWVPKAGHGSAPNFRTRKQVWVFVLLLTLAALPGLCLIVYAFCCV